MDGLGRRVQALAASLAPAARPDGELCAAWHARRDEAAFAELVRRHGRLVWGVCRRAGPDPDDSYQAVFLLLARRAGRLTGRTSAAPWLYLTAVRVARRAARTATRRRAKERRAAKPEAMLVPDPTDWRPAFDAVLAGLPAKYRDAVVLCELGGLPRAVAAERLRVAEGTLASRLAAARVLLRDRLVRRGVTVVVLTVAGSPPAVTAGVASEAARQLVRVGATMAVLKVVAVGAVAVAAGVLWLPAAAPAPNDPPPVPHQTPKPEPDWKAEFRKDYQPAPGQPVRLVPPPYPWYRAVSDLAEQPIGNGTALMIRWHDGRPDCIATAVGGPDRVAGFWLRDVIRSVCKMQGHEIEGVGPYHEHRGHIDHQIKGDWSFDPSASRGELVVAIDRILQDDCRLPVRLKLLTVDRPVLVAGGRYKPNPRPGREPGQVDIFGAEFPPGVKERDRVGSLNYFLQYDLADWVRTRVVDAVDEPRPAELRWYLQFRTSVQVSQAGEWLRSSDEADHDCEAVAATVAAQTGLTFRVERWKVDVVRIEPAEPAK